jgi:hypothetical protein
MVLCPDEGARAELEARLSEEGYGTVLGARSLVEAKDLTRGRRVDLLLALLPAEAMAGLLRLREKADLAGAVLVQGVPGEPDVKLRLSARASGVTHLVPAASLAGPGLLPQLEAWLGV